MHGYFSLIPSAGIIEPYPGSVMQGRAHSLGVAGALVDKRRFDSFGPCPTIPWVT